MGVDKVANATFIASSLWLKTSSELSGNCCADKFVVAPEVNKVESGVRLRYIWKNPNTGIAEEILIECTETRDQPKNKERALARLRTFIYDKEHQKYIDDIASKRKTMVSTGDRSAKIRTYNYPQGRITDHRINYTIYNLAAFMDGDIQDCIDHLIVAENAERLKESEL